MSNDQITRSAYERWREHRRVKRQHALEHEYFVREQARQNGLGDSSPSADLLNAHVRSSAYGTVWMSFFTGLGGP